MHRIAHAHLVPVPDNDPTTNGLFVHIFIVFFDANLTLLLKCVLLYALQYCQTVTIRKHLVDGPHMIFVNHRLKSLYYFFPWKAR